MNISGGISLSAIASNVGVTGNNSVSVRDLMAVSTMKAAMDMEKQTAATILSSLPDNVGRNINVTA